MLTTGRLMAQYQSGTQTRRHSNPDACVLQPEVELHPDLARRLKVDNADIVQLRTRRGAAYFRARITEDIRPEMRLRSVPLGRGVQRECAHEPGPRPALKMPEFKACAVWVVRVGSPADVHLLAAPPGAAGPPGRPEPSFPLRRPPPRSPHPQRVPPDHRNRPAEGPPP